MNLLKSLFSLSFMTLISRVLGFFRDLTIAHIFGVSIYTDAFFIAFKIPNLLRRLFFEGAFSQSFVPILIYYKSNKKIKHTKDFIASLSGLTIILLSIIILLGIIFSNYLIALSAPGFNKSFQKFKISCTLLEIMFPYILLVSLSSLYSSILNSWNYFAIPALSPSILNITIIICAIFFNDFFEPSILILSWSVIIGGFIQLIYQFPYLSKINMLITPKLNFKNIGLIKVIKKIGPSLIGSSANQISLIFNTIFSSLLNSGSISWMYYADRLIEFPIGILGVSLSTILFTSLSKSYSKNRLKEYKNLLNRGFRIALILSLPTSIVLFVLAKPLIIILFQYGKFTDFDVLMTQKALELYSFGLVAFILVKILSAAFYASQEINIPIRISLFSLFITQILNPCLIFYFQHAGLALSFSISGWINFFLLYWKLYQKKLINFNFNELIFIFRLFIAIFSMTFVLIFMLYFIPLYSIHSFFIKIICVFTILFVTGIIYLISLYFLGISFFK
ncbi:murein biosynthesis integral membrane protein MurJ [Buchnera aphidicola (Aphis craccivore)]|uniref:Probable lipid II flippase MurJ n=1 Tax=Buchnera aphidicola (Aphis craccivora) TaxID=466616 RepID=A0AA95E488_9GAMM|nr:murein biosynthesis integral membrane protein MurJ [Buchnera aphidicola]QLL40709.1 murein biosynthesis integral membrane protein MurJ [Buchnera aphidicola (Aphis craccivore)]WAI17548.1 MAG: murein biosynthesis integral membrane protein MurJ [Buchnera aphidicola (Aphis craccivora)]